MKLNIRDLLLQLLNLTHAHEGNQNDLSESRWNSTEFANSHFMILGRIFLYLLNIDIFRVFKQQQRQQDDNEPKLEVEVPMEEAKSVNLLRLSKRDARIFSKPELQMQSNLWDRLQWPISKLISAFICYVVIKILFVTLIIPRYLEAHPCKPNHQHQATAQPNAGPNSSSTSSSSPATLQASIKPSLLSGKQILQKFSCLLERVIFVIPLSNLSKVFLAGLASISYAMRAYIIIQQRGSASGMAPLRFIYEPKRELRRIDLLSLDIIKELQNSAHYFRSAMLQALRIQVSNKADGSTRLLLKSLSSIMDLLEDDRRQLSEAQETSRLVLLRPDTFRLFWYKVCRQLMGYIYLSVILGSHMLGVVFATLVMHSMWTYCNTVYTCPMGFFEIEFMFECFIVVPLNIHPYMMLVALIVYSFVNQFKLLAELRQILADGLLKVRKLRLELPQEDKPEQLEQPEQPQQPRRGRYCGRSKPSTVRRRLISASFKAESLLERRVKLRANRVMLKLVLRFLIYKHELSCLGEALSFSVGGFLACVWAMIYAVIALEFFKVKEVLFPRYILLPVSLGLANLIAFACAYCTARLIDLERLGWSILAELLAIHRQHSNGQPIWQQTSGLGFSSILWQRQVQGCEVWRTKLAPRPLNKQITYHDILETNFFLISIVSIFILR